MNNSTKSIALLFSLSVLTACGTYQNLGKGSTSNSNAAVTTASGMSLYTFDKDSNGESACYDACALKWPPYLGSEAAPAQAATKSQRKDGSEQWVLNGSPLYTWVGDVNPGDTTGDGVGGVWHTARLAATKSTTSNSSDY